MSPLPEPDVGPMLRPGNIVFDSPDPRRLAAFWMALTGYESRELFGPYVGARDPVGRGPHLTFQQSDTLSPPGRCHIDMYADDPLAAAGRARSLGARTLRTVAEGGVTWIVLADPDGNEFCIVESVGTLRRP